MVSSDDMTDEEYQRFVGEWLDYAPGGAVAATRDLKDLGAAGVRPESPVEMVKRQEDMARAMSAVVMDAGAANAGSVDAIKMKEPHTIRAIRDAHDDMLRHISNYNHKRLYGANITGFDVAKNGDVEVKVDISADGRVATIRTTDGLAHRRKTPLGPLISMISDEIYGGSKTPRGIATDIAKHIVRAMKVGFPMADAPLDAPIMVKARSRRSGILSWEKVEGIIHGTLGQCWYSENYGPMKHGDWEFLAWLPTMPIYDDDITPQMMR